MCRTSPCSDRLDVGTGLALRCASVKPLALEQQRRAVVVEPSFEHLPFWQHEAGRRLPGAGRQVRPAIIEPPKALPGYLSPSSDSSQPVRPPGARRDAPLAEFAVGRDDDPPAAICAASAAMVSSPEPCAATTRTGLPAPDRRPRAARHLRRPARRRAATASECARPSARSASRAAGWRRRSVPRPLVAARRRPEPRRPVRRQRRDALGHQRRQLVPQPGRGTGPVAPPAVGPGADHVRAVDDDRQRRELAPQLSPVRGQPGMQVERGHLWHRHPGDLVGLVVVGLDRERAVSASASTVVYDQPPWSSVKTPRGRYRVRAARRIPRPPPAARRPAPTRGCPARRRAAPRCRRGGSTRSGAAAAPGPPVTNASSPAAPNRPQCRWPSSHRTQPFPSRLAIARGAHRAP